MAKDKRDTAKMVLFAADREVVQGIKRTIAYFATKVWKPGDFDVIVIGTKKGSGPRAAQKIREALEVEGG